MRQQIYVQLSLEERDRIARYRAQELSISEMARRLQRNKSTISRELQRNRTPTYDAYGGGSADRRAHQRKRAAGCRPRLKNARIRSYVYTKLIKGWSPLRGRRPELIAGRLPMIHPGLKISHEAVYQYIYNPSVRRQEDLVPYLVRAHHRRQIKGHCHTHRTMHIPERISIHQRPQSVHQRKQVGHWESDSVMARQSVAGLHVLVERKTRLVKISKLKRRTARNTRSALINTLSHYPSHLRRTITYDNGAENVEHAHVNAVLGTTSYFCEPFHSWEKGTVENTIGLIRRTFPKKTNFDCVSIKEIKQLERSLNNRPRKVLHFKTPLEVFKSCVALAR